MEHLKRIPFRYTSKTERNTGRLLLVGIIFILLGSLFLVRECGTQQPAFNIEQVQ